MEAFNNLMEALDRLIASMRENGEALDKLEQKMNAEYTKEEIV